MSPAMIRPLLHSVHVVTFGVLLATGLLLLLPGLRGAITGGYSQWIRDGHRWGGVAYAVLPLLICLRFGVRDLVPRPAVRTLRTVWQAIHTGITVLMGILFTVTGAVIWARRSMPENLVEASHTIHDLLTYAAIVLVATHLVEIGLAALVERFKMAASS